MAGVKVIGMDIGRSEAETFWTAVPAPTQSLRSVKLVVSDGPQVLNASWRDRQVHFMRNALAHPSKSGQPVVSALTAIAFTLDEPRPRQIAEGGSPASATPSCSLAAVLDEAETGVLAYMAFRRSIGLTSG